MCYECTIPRYIIQMTYKNGRDLPPLNNHFSGGPFGIGAIFSGVCVGVGVPLGSIVGVGVGVGVGVPLGPRVCVGIGVCVGVDVGPGVGSGIAAGSTIKGTA